MSDPTWKKHERSKGGRKRWVWPASLEFPDLNRRRGDSGYIPECLTALGLPANATLDEVKRAFRSLSKQHHPDHGGDDKSFIRLRENYERATWFAKTRAAVTR